MEEAKPKDEDASKKPVVSQTPSPTASSNDDVATAVDDADSAMSAENVDHRFELRDINVRFPEGQLSVITGPTASGKTALLVCHLFYNLFLC